MKYKLLTTLFLACLILISCKDKSPAVVKTISEVKKPIEATLLYEIPSQLGEGAFWNYKTQEFYWIDIEGKQLHIYNPAKTHNRSFPTPSRIGTVVPQNDSIAIVALEDGIYTMNTNTGSVSLLSDVESEMTINRFNDGKCDPNGNLWVGSMNLKQEAATGSVYKVSENGESIKMIDSVTISNGIVWTGDASTMYYIDTPTGKIQAFDYDTETATISNERTAVIVDPKDGFPDGMTIDENDNLWVGLWNGNAVGNYNPKTGELIQKISVPAHNVTACAFGGEQLDKLYITTASIDMTPEEKEQYPLAGLLFIADVGVKGVPGNLFGTTTNE